LSPSRLRLEFERRHPHVPNRGTSRPPPKLRHYGRPSAQPIGPARGSRPGSKRQSRRSSIFAVGPSLTTIRQCACTSRSPFTDRDDAPRVEPAAPRRILDITRNEQGGGCQQLDEWRTTNAMKHGLSDGRLHRLQVRHLPLRTRRAAARPEYQGQSPTVGTASHLEG